jgi:hypothetical protein
LSWERERERERDRVQERERVRERERESSMFERLFGMRLRGEERESEGSTDLQYGRDKDIDLHKFKVQYDIDRMIHIY